MKLIGYYNLVFTAKSIKKSQCKIKEKYKKLLKIFKDYKKNQK